MHDLPWIPATVAIMLLLTPAGAAPDLSLRPGLPALADPGVPALWATVPDADRVMPQLRLESSRPYHWVFEPGESIQLRVAVPAGAGSQALLTAWDWEVRPVAQCRLRVPGEMLLECEVEGRGTYLLTLDLLDEEGCVAQLARSLSVCPSNLEARRRWREEEYFLGTCAYPGRQHWRNDYGPAHPAGLSEQEARDLDAHLSERLGLQVVRIDPPVWWGGEEEPLDFTRADASMEAWTTRGFRIALQLMLPGDWAVKPEYADVPDPRWRYPKREAPARRLVAECVRRYARHAAFIELYNEPDNLDFWRGRPHEYLDWARWAMDEIRSAAPDGIIVNGGYCLLEPEWTGLFARELRGRLDAIAYHSHGELRALEAVFDAMRAVHAAADYRDPIFINTEMGYAAWRLDMERHQAATAAQKVLYCWAQGHRGALLYCSRDVGGPRQRPGDPDWGCVDHFFCPRFMYGAVAALIDTYAGAGFERILLETQHAHAYLFRRGDESLVACFTPGGSRRLQLKTDATAAQLIDPMGNPTPVAGGAIDLEAGFYPQTVVLRGATEVTVSDES